FGRTVGVDSSEDAVAFCHDRGFTNVRLADLDRLDGLPRGDGSLVVLADVIEHLDDEGPCLDAAHDLLAPGGVLLVTVPAFMFLWGPSDELSHHKRRYTERELRDVIARRFEIERLTYFNTFLFGVTALGRLVERALARPGDETAGVPPAPVNAALR